MLRNTAVTENKKHCITIATPVQSRLTVWPVGQQCQSPNIFCMPNWACSLGAGLEIRLSSVNGWCQCLMSVVDNNRQCAALCVYSVSIVTVDSWAKLQSHTQDVSWMWVLFWTCNELVQHNRVMGCSVQKLSSDLTIRCSELCSGQLPQTWSGTCNQSHLVSNNQMCKNYGSQQQKASTSCLLYLASFSSKQISTYLYLSPALAAPCIMELSSRAFLGLLNNRWHNNRWHMSVNQGGSDFWSCNVFFSIAKAFPMTFQMDLSRTTLSDTNCMWIWIVWQQDHTHAI